MTKAQKRDIAIRTAKYYLKSMGIDFLTVSSNDALKALEDYCRFNNDTIAAEWYFKASDNQIRLFYKNWKQAQKDYL